jgi:hypothetical protein
MNAERLHAIAAALEKELSEREIIDTLQSLTSALNSAVQQNTPANQQQLVTARDAFYEAISDTPSDHFTPAWRQILVEMGGEKLFGTNLKLRVQQIIADNQMTPSVAHGELKEILEELKNFRDRLTELKTAFELFNIGAEELAPGAAEIGILILRAAVHDKLGDFTEELEEVEFILNTLSEVATGRKDDLKIRTVSSSDLIVFLYAAAPLACITAKVIDFVVGQYKKILDIKKVQLEIDRLELPVEISDKTKEHANKLMEKAIEEFSVTIINEFKGDQGRKNELATAVKISLNAMANRIDRGFNFEVRIEPPDQNSKDKTDMTEKAVRAVQAAAANMQYMKLEGPPILALPEAIDDGVSQKRKGKKRREKVAPDSDTQALLSEMDRALSRSREGKVAKSNNPTKQEPKKAAKLPLL